MDDKKGSTENVDKCTNENRAEAVELTNRTDYVESMTHHVLIRSESDTKTSTEKMSTLESSKHNEFLSQLKSHDPESEWSLVGQTERKQNPQVIDPRQMGLCMGSVTNSTNDFRDFSSTSKDDALNPYEFRRRTRSQKDLPPNLKTKCFKNTEVLASGSSYPARRELQKKRKNYPKKSFSKEKYEEIYPESLDEMKKDLPLSLKNIPSASSSTFVNEIENVGNLLTDKLSLTDQTVFRVFSTTEPLESNENLGLPKRECANMQRLQIESTRTDYPQLGMQLPGLDSLPRAENIGRPKIFGKKTRKNANPLIILSPPSDSSNQGIERNSPKLEEKQSCSHPMDHKEVKSLKSSGSDKSYDHQVTGEVSPKTKSPNSKKGKTQRRRKIGRSETRESLDLNIPSSSYQNSPTESQDKLDSTESDVTCDREYMEILEKTGSSPDVKDLKKKIRREKSMSKSRHLRSNSGSHTKQSSVWSRGWSVNSYERDQPANLLPSKQDTSDVNSSSNEQDSLPTTTKKHRIRKKRIALRPSDLHLVKSNSALIRKAESLSSSEDSIKTRSRRHSNVEDLKTETDAMEEVFNLSQDASRNPRMPRSPIRLRSKKRNSSRAEHSDSDANVRSKKRHKRNKSTD